MQSALAEYFCDWQGRRRKLCHDRLKNEILNVALAVSQPDDAAELMSHAEWMERLQRWDNCLAQAMKLILGSAFALSPARFLEADVWLLLPSCERRQYGAALDAEWWTVREMDQKIDAALAVITSARESLSRCFKALDGAETLSWDFVRAIQELALKIHDTHAALKSFDFDPIWK